MKYGADMQRLISENPDGVFMSWYLMAIHQVISVFWSLTFEKL